MLVSIYTPTKNRLPLLKKAVDSVLSQTVSDIEMIVTDDGSSDGTLEYLTSTANNDPRLRFVHHETSLGAQISRNEAIGLAQGTFVTGLDDDDEFHSRRVEVFLKQWDLLDLVNAERVFLYSQDVLYVDGAAWGFSDKKGSVKEDDLLTKNEVGNQVFVPKAALLAAGGFRKGLPAWQDLDMFMRLLKGGGTGRLVDIPTYNFDISPRPDRISGNRPRIRKAFEILSSERESLGDRQQLMLQMFAPHYGFRPNLSEIVEFVRMGYWPAGSLKMLKCYFGKY